MGVERGSGWDGEDLRAIDHSVGVVANHSEDAHDELEVALQLHLIGFGRGEFCSRDKDEWYSLTKLCHSQEVLELRANCQVRGQRRAGKLVGNPTYVVVRLKTHDTLDGGLDFTLCGACATILWFQGRFCTAISRDSPTAWESGSTELGFNEELAVKEMWGGVERRARHSGVHKIGCSDRVAARKR